jgi:hypothetical protein
VHRVDGVGDLLIGEVARRALRVGGQALVDHLLDLAEHSHCRRVPRFAQERPELRRGDRLLEFAPLLGDRERAHHLREVSVAREAGQEVQLLTAVLLPLIAEPGALPVAVEEHPIFARIGHGSPRPAVVAAHHDLAEIAGRALVEEEVTPAAVAGRFGFSVNEPLPRKLLEVSLLARRDETNGHTVAALGAPTLVAVLLPAPALEVTARFERATLLAGRRRVVPRRPGAKTSLFRELDPERLGTRCDLFAKARLVERRERLGRVIAPEVEPADQHRVIDEIHHRAGAEGRDELAESNLSFGRLLSAAFAVSLSHQLFPF